MVHFLTYHTEITNKMQRCTRIYYSNVYQLINMFRATHRSLPGAQNCNCSLWFYIRLWLPAATGNHKLMSGHWPSWPSDLHRYWPCHFFIHSKKLLTLGLNDIKIIKHFLQFISSKLTVGRHFLRLHGCIFM